MEEQSGREFASADAKAGAQGAAVQESRFGAEISLHARRSYEGTREIVGKAITGLSAFV
jgi:hypothetical protein